MIRCNVWQGRGVTRKTGQTWTNQEESPKSPIPYGHPYKSVMDSVIIVRLKYNAPRKREIIKYEWEIVVVNPKTRFGYPFQNFATKPCGARDGWRWKIFELPMVENCLMSRNVFYARVTRFVNVWNAMVKDRLKIIDPSMIDIDWYGNCDESPKKNDNHICVCVNYKLLSIYEFRSETRPHPHNLFLSLQTAFDLVVERHWFLYTQEKRERERERARERTISKQNGNNQKTGNSLLQSRIGLNLVPGTIVIAKIRYIRVDQVEDSASSYRYIWYLVYHDCIARVASAEVVKLNDTLQIDYYIGMI